MEETRQPSCFDCIHKPACKWDASALDQLFPFKSDHAIAGYLKAITEAQAEACRFFDVRKEEKS